MARIFAVLAWIAIWTLSSAAARPLADWTREYDATSVTLTSPADANGALVVISVGVTEKASADPAAEFKAEVDKVIASLDADLALTLRSGLRTIEGVLLETLKVSASGVPVDVTIPAYPAGGGTYTASAINARYRLVSARDFDRTAPAVQRTTTYDNTRTAPPAPPPPAGPAPQTAGKRCERRPVWGFRVSYWCQPSGVCNDRVIKGYETVCE